MKQVYRLAKRWHPYVPYEPTASYGPGCAIPWPEFSMRAVGYVPVRPGVANLTIKNPDKHGLPDGGRWIVLGTWQTGWMSIQSLITGEVHFSVPPGTLEPIPGETYAA